MNVNTTESEVEVFSHQELLVMSFLKSLDKDERIKHGILSALTGIHERTLYEILESLRSKGEWIISSKKKLDLGHRYTDKLYEWNDYLKGRESEALTNLRSINQMRLVAAKRYNHIKINS